jgi:2'-5' RNA ligase
VKWLNSQKQRLFVAIRIPEKLQTSLWRWIEGQQQHFPFQKWIHPKDIHLTLQFLGNTTENQKQHIIAALRALCKNQHPFSLHFTSLGTFGLPKRPKILWADVAGNLDNLHLLQRRITTTLTPIGFPPENRPYRPHVTLARNYNGQHFSKRELEKEWALCGESWVVDGIVLYQTMLGKTPMYNPVKTFLFK